MTADTLYVDTIQSSTAPTFALMMIQMIGMLLLITVLLYLSLYFFKKINSSFKNKSESSRLKIHERIYFSTKQGMSVVSFGKKVYLIGFSNNSVNLIDEIKDSDIVENLTNNTQKQRKFSDVIKFFKP